MSAFDILPHRSGSAAENMVTDFLMLKRYPELGHARLRTYGWHRAAFTFGYSQKISFVRAQLPSDERIDLCRRPTGGGVVDHRNDWTYCLVIPKGHAWFEVPAPASYKAVHQVIADTLNRCGEAVELKEVCEPDGECEAGPTVCFKKPERFDVLRKDNGAKVAGAAQKRTKEGLLFQGSLARSAVAETFDWDTFAELFTEALAHSMGLSPSPAPMPEWNEGEWEALVEQYSSSEWNEFR